MNNSFFEIDERLLRIAEEAEAECKGMNITDKRF